MNPYMTKNDLPIYHRTRLIAILAAAVLSNHSQEHAYKSQQKTTLADLNQYTAKMCLVIILTDDGIKYTCIWPLT